MTNRVALDPVPCGPRGTPGTPLVAAAQGTTASINASLAGSASAVTYITGFEVCWSNPTAAANVLVTVSGLLGGVNLVYEQQLLAAGVAVPAPVPMVIEFPEPIPASALNTAITVTVGALGAGASFVTLCVHGFSVPS